jgi:hypothetical protein
VDGEMNNLLWFVVICLILIWVSVIGLALYSMLVVKDEKKQDGFDLRKPGEKFCWDCKDHEGCMQGIPCSIVKRVNP